MRFESNGIDLMSSVLSIYGFTRPKKSWSWWQKMAHYSLCATNCSVATASLTVGVIQATNQLIANEYHKAWKKLCILSGLADALCMVLFALTQWSKITAFNKSLKDMTAEALVHSPSEASIDIYKRHARYSRGLVLTYLVSIGFLTVFWMSLSFIIFFFYPDVKNEVWAFVSFADAIDSHAAIDSWPFVVLELLRCWVVSLTVPLKCTFPPVLVILFEGQLSILEESLRMIQRSSLNLKSTTHSDLMIMSAVNQQITDSRKIHSVQDEPFDVTVQLKHCIRYHQKILRLMKQMKQFVGPILFTGLIFIFVFVGNAAAAIITGNLSGAAAWLMPLTLVFYLSAPIYHLWSLASLKSKCSRVGLTAYGTHFCSRLSNRGMETSLLLMVKRSQVKEKFPCVLTSDFTMPHLYKLLELCWSYVTMSRKQALKTQFANYR